jgi:VWFA-related protein
MTRLAKSSRFPIACVLPLACVSWLLAQEAERSEPAPPPVLRVQNISVVVDVVVTGRDNRPVVDLGPEDFEILEDGVVQPIETFRAVSPEGARSGDVLDREQEFSAQTRPDEQLELAREPNLIILLLDYATTEFTNQNYVREAASRYVKERLGPNDLMAVFRVGMSLQFVQGFTNDRVELLAALEKQEAAGSMYAADQALLADFAQTAQDRVELLTTQINSLSGAQGFAPLGSGAIVDLLNLQLMQAQQIEGTHYANLSYSREQQSRPVIGAIETIARGVRHIPGRKTLIFFSQGFSVPYTVERALYRAIEEANRNNVAVYPIDSGGLQWRAPAMEGELYDISALRAGDRVKAFGGLSQFDRAREIGSDQKDSTLRYIAAATGGLFLRHTNDLLSAMERVDADVRSHYLLTYRPTNLNFDGQFRDIQVKVGEKNLTVRHRSGYWAIPPGASMLSAEEYQSLIAANGKAVRDPLPLYAHAAHFPAGMGEFDVHLTVEVPNSDVRPQKLDDATFLHVTATGLVLDQFGDVVTSFRGPSRVQVSQKSLETLQMVRFDTRFRLSPGAYSVLVHARDPVSGRASFQQRSLRLEPMAGSPSVSSLVLAKDSDLTRMRGEDHLSVEGIYLNPTASRRFRSEESLVYLVNLYNPGLDGSPRKTRLQLETGIWRHGRLMHRQVEVIQESNVRTHPVPHVQLARFLNLSALQPGAYILRTRLLDEIAESECTSQAAFWVR